MSMGGGVDPAPAGGWTVETLHAHLQRQLDDLHNLMAERFSGLEKQTDANIKSTREAVDKAEGAMERRFEAVNEFRAQLADQAARFLTRDEYEAKHDALAERVTDAVHRSDRTAAVEAERFRDIELKMIAQFERTAGRSVGFGDSWKFATAALGAIATLLAIYAVVRGP